MSVLQLGVPKSGNYWLHRILSALHDRVGIRGRSFLARHPIQRDAQNWELSMARQASIDMVDIEPDGYYFGIASVFRARIEDLDEYVRSCRIVWSHSPYSEPAAAFFDRFASIVYVVRDPRDVAVSMAHFRFTPYSLRFYPHAATASPREYVERNLDDLVWYWVKHVSGYLAVARRFGIHFVFYEQLLHDQRGELAALARALDLPLAERDFDAVAEALAFDAMRRESPGHVRQGRAGGWREFLTVDQIARVDELAAPMLELLGYPLACAVLVDADRNWLPAEPTPPIGARLLEAYEHGRAVARRRCRAGWEL